MKNKTTLIYDGSFNGFLSSVYNAFEEKYNVIDIQKNKSVQSGLFSNTETIFTNISKAKRVWNGIKNKSYNAITNIYFAFLSETDGMENMLYNYIQKLMSPKETNQNFSDETISFIEQQAKKVSAEKQHMESAIRFKCSKDQVYVAHISPKYDVLPLVSKYFRNRYKNQEWLIYDLKRRYGIFYDKNHVEIVSLNLKEMHSNLTAKNNALTVGEYAYQEQWNNYFQKTNIKSQINKKLLAQNTSKRPWKNLSQNKEAV